MNYIYLDNILEAENHKFTEEFKDEIPNICLSLKANNPGISQTLIPSIMIKINKLIVSLNFKDLYDYIKTLACNKNKDDKCILDFTFFGFTLEFIIKKIIFISLLKDDSKVSL